MNDFDTFKKLPKNVGDLSKLIVAKRFQKSPKVQKSPNLVTLEPTQKLQISKALFSAGNLLYWIELQSVLRQEVFLPSA